MVDHKQALQDISFFAGNRFDLVQAGGGNTSAKTGDNNMLVKASGINLSQVTTTSGYVPVDFLAIRHFLANFDFSKLDKKQREVAANKAMQDSKLVDLGKPSIETFLHALLATYTLHTHPVSVNILAAKKSWKEGLLGVWPDAICVPYHTPGIDLALAMASEMNAYVARNGHFPKVVFLQNHGLIISSSDPQEVMALTDEVTRVIEKHLQLNLARYRRVTALQTLLSSLGHPNVSIICNDDAVIQDNLACEKSNTEVWPFCPDTLIYCGVRPVFLNHQDDQESIQKYINSYHAHPKVLVLDEHVYFCAASLKKAKEAQELFKFHLLVCQKTQAQTQRLKLSEIA
ncbi:MAG: class II aldolase/adducin family protein [Colwellia sp.]